MESVGALLREARLGAGLSQRELAARASTSQSVVHRVEHGVVDPSVGTLSRLLAAAGCDLRLDAVPRPRGSSGDRRPTARDRPFARPEQVGELSHSRRHRTVTLPRHLRWSGAALSYDMDRPEDRARVYEQALREGDPADVRLLVDGPGLAESWDTLVLPPAVRRAWAPVVDALRSAAC